MSRSAKATKRPVGGEPNVPLIAHVIHRLDVGGMENGLVNLINGIPPERYRHAIVCLTDHTEFRTRIRREVPCFALHKRPGKDLGLYARVYRVLRELEPDIVHTRNLAALEAQAPAMLAGVPARVHGEHGRDVHDLDNRSRKYRLLRAAFRGVVGHYVTVSRELERYLVDSVGVRAERITRICNGVDTERFRPLEGGRGELGPAGFAPRDGVIVGAVGRMEAVKDHPTLARAFAKLVGACSNGKGRLRLVIIGDGSRFDETRAILAEAGAGDLAWLPGARSDVPDLLAAMDVFVLPSLAEGISNTLLEAMASGLPVVATDVGGNPELVADGETGTLVPRGDPDALAGAIARYAEDAELRRRHGAAARERAVREFSLERMVEQYLGVYDRLLGERLRQEAAEPQGSARARKVS